MKVLFCGFEKDYELLELDEIVNNDNIVLINLSYIEKTLLRLYSKMFSNNIALLNKFFHVKGHGLDEFDKIIIKDNLFYLELFKDKKCNVKAIYRNTVNNITEAYLNIYDVYSFDSGDVDKYCLKQYEQFASGYKYLIDNKFGNKYDIAFIGEDKGRSELIKRLSFLFDNNMVKIFNRKTRLDKLFEKLLNRRTGLTYIEYLNCQLNTKAVLDIVKDGQTGQSMRFIEAMIAKKKIITNNKLVVNHELYDSNNVFILDEITFDYEKIVKFIESKFIDVPNTSLARYNPTFVINKIIHE